MSSLRVGVLGPGAIGGLLAARLGKAGHDVTVIATERTAVAIELEGLTLRTPHEQLETRPIPRPWLTTPVEVLFVTTKATELPAALERTPPHLLAASTIVPLLNGIDHLSLLRARYPESRVVAASISVQASRPRLGVTEQHSIGCELRVTADRTAEERQWTVDSLLRGPGLDVYTDPDETRILWQKLASVAPYALLTTSANAPLGPARERYPNWLTALATEAADAAGRAGVRIDASLLASRQMRIPDDMRSSMLNDQLAERPLELHAIAGPILRALGASGAPTTAAAVREILTLRDARSPVELGRRRRRAVDGGRAAAG
jgi:2-dehydropantoate 2-reductase